MQNALSIAKVPDAFSSAAKVERKNSKPVALRVEGRRDDYVGTFSGGMKRRLNLASVVVSPGGRGRTVVAGV